MLDISDQKNRVLVGGKFLLVSFILANIIASIVFTNLRSDKKVSQLDNTQDILGASISPWGTNGLGIETSVTSASGVGTGGAIHYLDNEGANIAIDSSGGTFFAWNQASTTVGKLVNSDGTTGCNFSSSFAFTHMTEGAAGEAIIVNDSGRKVMKIDNTCTTVYPETDIFPLNPSRTHSTMSSISDGSGGAFLVGINLSTLYLQRIDSSGNILWGTNGIAHSLSSGTISAFPILNLDGAGGVIVSFLGGSTFESYIQRFNSTGSPLWGVSPINLGGRMHGAVMSSGNLFTLTQEPSNNIYLQKFNLTGSPQFPGSGIFLANSSSAGQSLSADGLGGVVVGLTNSLTRLDSNGNQLWSLGSASTGFLYRKILMTQDNSFIMTAHSTCGIGIGFDISVTKYRLSDGRQVSPNQCITSLAGAQTYPKLINSGTKDSIIYWSDTRAGNVDIYAFKTEFQNQITLPLADTLDVQTPSSTSIKKTQDFGTFLTTLNTNGSTSPNQSLTVKYASTGNRIADVEVNMTNDRIWDTLTTDQSLDGRVSFIGNLLSTEGMNSTTTTLYLRSDNFDDYIRICPDATNLSQVTNSCINAQLLALTHPSVTQVSHDGDLYWQIDGLTTTGGAMIIEFVPTATPSPTLSPTPTETPTPTITPTNSPVPTVTPTSSPVPTVTPTNSPVPTVTPTNSPVPTVTPTNSPVTTATPTSSPVPTVIPTNSPVTPTDTILPTIIESTITPSTNVSPTTTRDSDGDGISDDDEEELGTDPNDPDTDGDGLTDGFENEYNNPSGPLDPTNPDSDGNGIDDNLEDYDNDGLTNEEEQALGFNPNITDSNGNGIIDGDEKNDNDNPIFVSDDEFINSNIVTKTLFKPIEIDILKSLQESVSPITSVSEVVTPTVLLGGAVITSSLNLLYFPGFINFALLWFRKSKKEKPWGVVFDNSTKKPVPFVTVRVLNNIGDFIKQTISDLQGRYSFSLDIGEYFVQAIHPDFSEKTERISIGIQDQVLSKDIALDKENLNGENISSIIKENLSTINSYLFYIGIFLSLISIILAPNLINSFVIVLYTVQIIFLRKLKIVSAGNVADENGNRIGGAFVRLFSKEEQRQLDVSITDASGRYSLQAEKGEYLVQISSNEFVLDENKHTENLYVSQNGEKFIRINLNESGKIDIPFHLKQKTNSLNNDSFGESLQSNKFGQL